MEKFSKIAWNKNLDLSTVPEGMIVTGVPLRHPIFKLPFERAMTMCRSDWHNWEQVNKMLDRGLELPVYYCLKCNQIEEGKFRLFAAQIFGKKKANIMTWGDCRRVLKKEMQTIENKIVSGEIGF